MLFSAFNDLQTKTKKYGIKVSNLNIFRSEFVNEICNARAHQFSNLAVYETLMISGATNIAEAIQGITSDCSSGLFPTIMGNDGLTKLCMSMLPLDECLHGLEAFRDNLRCVINGPIERNDNEIRINLEFHIAAGKTNQAKTYKILAPPTFHLYG